MKSPKPPSDQKFTQRFAGYFAFAIVLIIAGIITALIFVEIPEANKSVLIALAGALTGLLTAIGQYYWGSSLGSKSKDETIRKIACKEED